MALIIEGFQRAFSLLVHLDPELLGIIYLSIKVSGLALCIAAVSGIPLGAVIGLRRFFGKGLVVSILNTFMGLPPVVVGLFLYLILSRSGPLGFMGLLYSPTAMIMAQTILALPIIIALSLAAVTSVDETVKQSARALGATSGQISILVINEARYSIMAAVIAAFGRVIAEVGAVLIVGGNIAGLTRVMTTTIALETDKGDFELALALGIVLLAISLIANAGLHLIQKKGVRP
jgi:tungstate transport system permease protein